MRPVVTVLFLAVLTVPAIADSDGTTYYSYAEGKRFKVTITKDAVAKAPAWKADADNPPLSARKARQAADAALARLLSSKGENWTVMSLDLTPVEGGWVWTARYRSPEGVGGRREAFLITVLMNGAVVEPLIKDSKY